jgi:hypothetical protein
VGTSKGEVSQEAIEMGGGADLHGVRSESQSLLVVPLRVFNWDLEVEGSLMEYIQKRWMWIQLYMYVLQMSIQSRQSAAGRWWGVKIWPGRRS